MYKNYKPLTLRGSCTHHFSQHPGPALFQSSEDPMTYICTAQCSDSIVWSITDPQTGQQPLDQMLRPSIQECSGDTVIEMFKVPDNPELNGTMIQCIAIQTNSRSLVCFSECDILRQSSHAFPTYTHIYIAGAGN